MCIGGERLHIVVFGRKTIFCVKSISFPSYHYTIVLVLILEFCEQPLLFLLPIKMHIKMCMPTNKS